MHKDTEQIHNILKTNTLPHHTDGGKEPEISYSDYIDPEVIGSEGEKVSGTFVCAHRYAGQPHKYALIDLDNGQKIRVEHTGSGVLCVGVLCVQ